MLLMLYLVGADVIELVEKFGSVAVDRLDSYKDKYMVIESRLVKFAPSGVKLVLGVLD